MQSDWLFAMIDPAALYDRPITERHRVIFYLGHLEAFEWNLLRGERKPFNAAFDRLFAFGIDPVGGDLPSDQPSDWPGTEEVHRYNCRVREALDAADHSELLLNVAIEHRLMHAETLAYMLHQLPLEKKRRPEPAAPAMTGPPRIPGMVEVPEGPVTLGLPRGAPQFGWDNEFDAHVVTVPRFAIDRYKVTNGDYLEFVRAGGEAPVFWRSRGGEWDYRTCAYRTMFDQIPLPLDWPVYVSHSEASAYARWVGKELPTESEWQRAACGAPSVGNFDGERWDPVPVTAFGHGASGMADMHGNGWEWTSTVFAPFAGFEPFPFYAGYSAGFFDGRHFVMKGGSARTAACMMRPSFRNWFQPDYPYVYAGFRCVSR